MKGEESCLSLVSKVNAIVCDITIMLNTIKDMCNCNFTLRVNTASNIFYIQRFGEELTKLAIVLYDLEKETSTPDQTPFYCYSYARSDAFSSINESLQKIQVDLQRFIIQEGHYNA